MVTIPERIGRYRVREVIGRGGFATVYRATDERLHADVAVKVLADNHSIDADVRARFIEEGRRLRRVANPAVVTVHELGETDRAQPFLVLEWADRGDLATRVAAARDGGRPITPADVLTVARTVTAALATLHAHGLVHRDLAPRNLLLRCRPVAAPSPSGLPAWGPPASALPAGLLVAPDEQLMLADLGLSKDLAAASGYTVAAGTSGFAPPEQRRKDSCVDARSDIWAASALVVWLICGHPPEDGEDGEDEAWSRRVTDAGWPAALVPVLRRGLAAEPEDRHPDVRQWMAEIEAALAPAAAPTPAAGGAASPTRASSLRPPRASLPPPGSHRRRRLRGAALVVAVLAAGFAAGLVMGRTAAGDASGPRPETERLAGGDLRTVVEQEGVRIELRGPTEIDVGVSRRVTAAVEGARTWMWVAPDGSVHAEARSLEVRPGSSGAATVRLLAIGDGGEVVEAAHTVTVPPESAEGS